MNKQVNKEIHPMNVNRVYIYIYTYSINKHLICPGSNIHKHLISLRDHLQQKMVETKKPSGLIVAWAALTPKPTICALAGGMVRDIKRPGHPEQGG